MKTNFNMLGPAGSAVKSYYPVAFVLRSERTRFERQGLLVYSQCRCGRTSRSLPE